MLRIKLSQILQNPCSIYACLYCFTGILWSCNSGAWYNRNICGLGRKWLFLSKREMFGHNNLHFSVTKFSSDELCSISKKENVCKACSSLCACQIYVARESCQHFIVSRTFEILNTSWIFLYNPYWEPKMTTFDMEYPLKNTSFKLHTIFIYSCNLVVHCSCLFPQKHQILDCFGFFFFFLMQPYSEKTTLHYGIRNLLLGRT